MFLQVVTDTRNVDGTFHSVDEPDPGDLAQSGIRLLRRSGRHVEAYSSLLGAALHDRDRALLHLLLTTLSDQLIDCWHLTFYLLFYFVG